MDKEKEIMIHILKTWPEYFQEVFMGHKTFELRKNDRDYRVGDCLILKEFNPETNEFTGRELARGISYVLKDASSFGLKDDFVILSLS